MFFLDKKMIKLNLKERLGVLYKNHPLFAMVLAAGLSVCIIYSYKGYIGPFQERKDRIAAQAHAEYLFQQELKKSNMENST